MGVHHEYFDQSITERRAKRYAVVIFLPAHLDQIVQPIREKYDPLYNLVPLHISLAFPFDSPEPLDELAGKIKKVADTCKSPVIEMHSIGDFYPKFPVIYWDIKKNQELQTLHNAIYESLNMSRPFQTYLPHATIAREISNHRVYLIKETVVPYLPSERFEASALDLITPLSGHKWVSVRTFSFGNSGTSE